MPVSTPRQQILAATQLASLDHSSISSHDSMNDHPWIVEDDFGQPQKEMDFHPVPFGKMPLRKGSMHNLRIHTYSKPDLHERYMSSEEEPSPSPDSATSTYGGDEEEEKELTHECDKAAETEGDEHTEVHVEDSKAEIAVAVPILAIGRPKLVDITNLAPMHKRKRSSTELPMLPRTAARNPIGRLLDITKENSSCISSGPVKSPATEEHPLKRTESLAVLAPESWLPEDDFIVAGEDERSIPELEIRRPPSYIDYDPYSLNPPKLSPRNSHNSPAKKPGSVARARKQTNAPLIMNRNAGLKGLAKSLSPTKQEEAFRPTRQIAKKPKMLARGATERTESPLIPPFSYEHQNVAA